MPFLKFEQAREYAQHRLERELSPALLYHGVSHTRDEVVPAAETIASMEGIPDEELSLLLTAAWFHDLGFIEQASQHELISARIAEDVLPDFGYGEDEIQVIKRAILATALPQSPRSLLEAILTDADLDSLGRESFMDRNADLRRELALGGKIFTDEEWYKAQLKFITEHSYFTASARALRDAQKRLNIAELKSKLAAMETSE